jgi:hypothetical protein
MSTIHLHASTTASPQQFLAALTDFGPGRSKIFGNSADDYLQVHAQGPQDADVTEGSGGVWERLHYDWSNPNRVVMVTTDSNVWGGKSGHTYTFTRNPTARPPSTPSSYARARTSRATSSGSSSAPSARASWPRHSPTPSRPSKPATPNRPRRKPED